MHGSRSARLARILILAIVTVSTVLLHKQATRAQEAARPTQNGQVTLPPVDVDTSKRAKQPKGKKQVAKRAPPIEALPPPKVESATGPAQGYLASRSATGSKTDTPLKEIPQSISVVTADQMRAQGVQNLAQALRYTPGVSSEIAGVENRCYGTQMRGFRDEADTPFYKDGQSLRGTAFSTFKCLEPYGAERIEVLRGPSSVLYGQGEPSGIINYVSKRPLETTQREIELLGGSFNHFEGRFDLTGPANAEKTLFYRLVGLVRDSDTQVDFTKSDRIFLAPSLTWKPNDDTTLTILGYYQRERTGWTIQFLPAQGTVLPNPFGKIPTNRFIGEPSFDQYNPTHLSIGYQFEHRANDIWTFRQNMRYAHLENPNQLVVYGTAFTGTDLRTFGRQGDFGNSKLDTVAVDNQAQAQLRTGVLAHKLLLGLDHQRYKFGDFGQLYDVGPIDLFNPVYGQALTPGVAYQDTHQTLIQTGLYVQDQIKLDRWIFTLGARQDWAATDTRDTIQSTNVKHGDQAFTWRAGVAYLFDSGLTPYAVYSTSFLPLLNINAEGEPLKPTTGQAYEVGVKYQPPGWNAFITLAAFDITKQNIATFAPPPTFSLTQTGEINSRGFEVEAVASLSSGWDLRAAYTYLEATITADADPAKVGKWPATIPRHQASAWADYTFRGGPLDGFGLGGGVRYIGSSFGSDINTFTDESSGVHTFKVPAVTLFDAAMHYDWRNYRFAINAQNLFDTEHVSACWNFNNACFYGARRNVILSARYRW